MAYDAGLVARLDEIDADNPTYEKKKMFGGFAYQLNGNISSKLYKYSAAKVVMFLFISVKFYHCIF